MSNLFIGAIASLFGIVAIAYKLLRDENASLKGKLTHLQNNIDLQPLNSLLEKAEKEAEDAKKAYNDSLVNPGDHGSQG